MSEPFSDHVGITVPEDLWDGLRADVSPLFDQLSMSVEVDGPRKVLWRSSCGTGTVKADKYLRVWSLGCSGTVCAGLRARGLFRAYLSELGSRPHRVKSLHAACDYPVDAAPVVQAVAEKGRAGGYSFTRKAVQPRDILTILAPRENGDVTGTVYCGSPRSQARMVVYDKRQERIRRGLPDTGELLRYELRLDDGAGITLKDCAEPSSVFWHHASPQFLPAPPSATPWVPYGSGFELARAPTVLPAARLTRRVEDSPEVGALLDLARELGPYGFGFLVSLLRKRGGFPE